MSDTPVTSTNESTNEYNRLRPELQRLLNILRCHPGKNKAISMLALYELWSGRKVKRDEEEKPIENVATLSRRMRMLIDELIDAYSIPIMSSSGRGYWIVINREELEMVHHEFMSRGIRSLQKAARLSKISLVEITQQLAMELQNENSDIHKYVRKTQAKKKTNMQNIGDLILGPEAKMAVITRHMQELFDSPDEYADQIRALQHQFGPKLLPQKVAQAINKQAEEAMQAVSRLQAMVNI